MAKDVAENLPAAPIVSEVPTEKPKVAPPSTTLPRVEAATAAAVAAAANFALSSENQEGSPVELKAQDETGSPVFIRKPKVRLEL